MIKCIWGKCLRWFSLCFRGLFGQFGVALKTIHLFGCPMGTLVVTKVLCGFFVSSESVSYPYGSGRKSEHMKQPCFQKKIIGDILSLYRTFQETFSQYLGIKMRITQPPKIVVKLLENLPTFQTNGTVIQKFVAFLKLYRFLDNIAPSNSYFTEKSLWMPLCKQRSFSHKNVGLPATLFK